MTLPVSVQDAFAWHERPGALTRMIPPWSPAKPISFEGIQNGERAVLSVPAPWPRKWVARHEDYDPPNRFVDVQEQGPMGAWRHEHLFAEGSEPGTSVLTDRITYAPPGGPFGGVVDALAIRQELEQAFAYRHRTLLADLEDSVTYATPRPLRIALSGSTGLIGRALKSYLTTQGHEVVPIVRHTPAGDGQIGWDWKAGSIEADKFIGLDAVVHLAGENIMGRWTHAKKDAIRRSRTVGTELIANALAELQAQDGERVPKVFVSASAIGYYGSQGDQPVDADTPAGEGFLAEVSRDWEAACEPARQAGLRVAHPRIGMVLTPRGAGLKPMLLPYKMGGGGPIGKGEFYWAWIGIDDVCKAILHAVVRDDCVGPFNLSAPMPVMQREFSDTLAKVLRRPAFMPAPTPMVRLAFGQELADAILTASIRAVPTRLNPWGFAFRHPDLESCLRHLLGKV